MGIRGLFYLMTLVVLVSLAGCQVLGYVAAMAPPATVEPVYKGLAGKRVGIMVYADNGLLMDRPALQLDTALGVQEKMKYAGGPGGKVAELKDIHWVGAERIVQFQQNHTELDGESVAEYAPRMGVDRLIYIEIDTFATHPDESTDLSRGTCQASIEVLEVTPEAAKVVYTEHGVSVVTPKKCPPEGEPGLSDDVVYRQTVDDFTTEVYKRFVPHEADVE
jgi:hypothetical protein